MKHEERRSELTERIAAIVLAEGLDALALRGLAERLGTSGRMLLYYFNTKDALVSAALVCVSQHMAALLRPIEEAAPFTPGTLVQTVLSILTAAAFTPFLRVWTDVVVRGGRGETPYVAIARLVVERWVEWTQARLLPEMRGQGHAVAIALLATIDGLTLLEMASPGCSAGARELLPRVWRDLP